MSESSSSVLKRNGVPQDNTALPPLDKIKKTMDKAQRTRLSTQPNSKLASADIIKLLSQPYAWQSLSAAARERIYSLMAPPFPGDPPHDIDINPVQSKDGEYIEKAILRWQADLKLGRETKKFQSTPIQVTKADLWMTDSEEESDEDGLPGEASKKSDEGLKLRNGHVDELDDDEEAEVDDKNDRSYRG